MPIEVWNLITPPQDAEYLYFRPEDEPVVAVAVTNAIANHARIPLTIRVTPNGVKQLGLVHAHIIGTSKNDFGWIGNMDFGIYEHPTRSILYLSAEIISGLREQSSDRVATASLELGSLINRINRVNHTSALASLLKISECLAKLTNECLSILEHGSPFMHTKFDRKNKSWWDSVPSLVGVLDSNKHEIHKMFGPTLTSTGLISIEKWLTDINTRLRRLSTNGTRLQKQDVLLEASAYCAALAERYHLRKNSSLAVLFLHRSADLCFMSVCAGNNMIDWTVSGGQYNKQNYQSKDLRITLVKSTNFVESMNLLSPDQNRVTDFNELNDWRNILIQTHYLSDIDDITVKTLFKKIRIYLEIIGGREWVKSRDFYLRGPQLSLSDFLDIDGSLSRSYDIVELETVGLADISRS